MYRTHTVKIIKYELQISSFIFARVRKRRVVRPKIFTNSANCRRSINLRRTSLSSNAFFSHIYTVYACPIRISRTSLFHYETKNMTLKHFWHPFATLFFYLPRIIRRIFTDCVFCNNILSKVINMIKIKRTQHSLSVLRKSFKNKLIERIIFRLYLQFSKLSIRLETVKLNKLKIF